MRGGTRKEKGELKCMENLAAGIKPASNAHCLSKGIANLGSPDPRAPCALIPTLPCVFSPRQTLIFSLSAFYISILLSRNPTTLMSHVT